MNKNNTIQASATRTNSNILVKPMFEGKTHRCYESGFNSTREDSIRVTRMEDMRLGIEDCTPEEFKEYLGKQPLFYFQERFAAECPGYEWNGFLLFSVNNHVDDARKVIIDHKDELHVILAFDDPDFDRYYILIDTETGGGSIEDFHKWRDDVKDMVLSRYLHKVKGHQLDYYCRAFTTDHYDIEDHDALFGKAVVTPVCQSATETAGNSILALIKAGFNRLFHKSA